MYANTETANPMRTFILKTFQKIATSFQNNFYRLSLLQTHRIYQQSSKQCN